MNFFWHDIPLRLQEMALVSCIHSPYNLDIKNSVLIIIISKKSKSLWNFVRAPEQHVHTCTHVDILYLARYLRASDQNMKNKVMKWKVWGFYMTESVFFLLLSFCLISVSVGKVALPASFCVPVGPIRRRPALADHCLHHQESTSTQFTTVYKFLWLKVIWYRNLLPGICVLLEGFKITDEITDDNI